MLSRDSGFTMVEILVVLGISMLVLLLALSFSFPQIQKVQLKTSVDDLTSLLFVTQQNAYSGKSGSAYGVRFGVDDYVLFAGESFATATSTESVSLPPDFSFTRVAFLGGGNDIVFHSGRLKPDVYGEVEISDGEEMYIITVNQQGLVDSELAE